jgi:hypothetical protein
LPSVVVSMFDGSFRPRLSGARLRFQGVRNFE